MPTRVDLHTHTTASDGRLAPAELARAAAGLGIEVLGITDHDTTVAIAAARAAAPPGLEILAGVEINSEGDADLGGLDVDFLGYAVDPDDAALQERLELIRNARLGRARGMVDKLAALGMPVRWTRVLEIAGDAESLARPHVARALLEAGYVTSLQEAFDRYLHDGGPAYVNRLRATASEAIGLVHRAGGLAVLAHPFHNNTAHLIPAPVDRGLDGIEVYYPDHTREQQAELLAIAQAHGLLVTGGSDFHAWDDGIHGNLGSQEVPWDVVAALRAARA